AAREKNPSATIEPPSSRGLYQDHNVSLRQSSRVTVTPTALPTPQAPRPPFWRRHRVTLISLSAAIAVVGAVVVVAAVVIGGYVASAPQIPDREALRSI